MDIFDQYATDPKLELEGVWVPIGPATGVLENGDADPETAPQVKVARSGNKRHGRMVSALYEANKTTLEMKDDFADAKGDEITVDTMAKSILLGWKNLSFKKVKLEDGWNVKDAKQMLAVKDFRDMVMKHASDFNKFKLKQEEVDAKN
jgi:hypothetical protein